MAIRPYVPKLDKRTWTARDLGCVLALVDAGIELPQCSWGECASIDLTDVRSPFEELCDCGLAQARNEFQDLYERVRDVLIDEGVIVLPIRPPTPIKETSDE